MNTRTLGVSAVILTIVGVVVSLISFGGGGRKTDAHPGPKFVVQKAPPRPVSDVDCNHTYQFDQIKHFRLNGRVVVNFHFGGRDRGRQPQYIVDKDVLGLSTEVSRRVDRSLEYNTVTVVCLSDTSLEGHRASSVQVLRYQLNLRRPLRQQTVIPEGGPARQ